MLPGPEKSALELSYSHEYENESREEWISAHLGDTCVARAKVRRSLNRVVIKFLTVHDQYQRQGIGRAVVEQLRGDVSEALAKGVKYQARTFWEKLGFQRCENPRYYIWTQPVTQVADLD